MFLVFCVQYLWILFVHVFVYYYHGFVDIYWLMAFDDVLVISDFTYAVLSVEKKNQNQINNRNASI